MNQYGFVRITCVSPRTTVADPAANAAEIVRVLDRSCADSDIVLFPELCVTGYTCADLFGQSALLDAGDPGRPADRRGDRRPRRSWSSSARRFRSATACSTAPS